MIGRAKTPDLHPAPTRKLHPESNFWRPSNRADLNDLDETYVFETYYRASFGDYFALTADVQWMNDDYENNSPEEQAKGWVFGLRTTAEF